MDNIGDRQHLDSIRSPSTSSLQGAFCAEAASPNILDSFWADSELVGGNSVGPGPISADVKDSDCDISCDDWDRLESFLEALLTIS
jgi:hypothetical protein